jgi:hypothetical protein
MTTDNTPGSFEKFEFWALTAVFIFSLPIEIAPETTNEWKLGFTEMNERQGGEVLSYYSNYLVPVLARYVVIFLAFLFTNFRLVPALVRKEFTERNILQLAGVIGLILILHFSTGFFYHTTLNDMFVDIFIISVQNTLIIMLLFGGYFIIRYAGLYLISKADAIQGFMVIFNRDSLVIFTLWMIITYCMIIIVVPGELWLAWFSIIPSGILLHGLAFYKMIPSSLRFRYPLISYFFQVGIFCFVVVFPIAFGILSVTDDEETAFSVGGVNGVFHFMFTAPALWLIYRWQMKGREQIFALQSELGRSAANLDFLRSQINPHFLFNALNTIYGLAIHEKAHRTSEAVEKLGDMMRFMLNENTQQRISLLREIEYLNNYISLQKLRTDSSPGLRIQVDIQEEVAPSIRITPMLLIPFVENAFKHGISMREESYIKVSLELKKSTLYFDVLNSTHSKSENDPEKNSNGIGLANVRHRLQHLYQGRHELLIRETSRDFFVHLRLDLD